MVAGQLLTGLSVVIQSSMLLDIIGVARSLILIIGQARYGYIYRRCQGHPRALKVGHYVFEHILLYEQYHKCCLLRWGLIHHRNGVRVDNRIENLQGLTKAQHNSLHKTRQIKTHN